MSNNNNIIRIFLLFNNHDIFNLIFKIYILINFYFISLFKQFLLKFILHIFFFSEVVTFLLILS